MKPIAVFYHCLFYGTRDNKPPHQLPMAQRIVREQMDQMNASGLTEAAQKIFVGINGGVESEALADQLLPHKAERIMHGLDSRAENLTLVALEFWVATHPGWDVLYFHSKGATHDADSTYGNNVSAPWRRAMMKYLVTQWSQCVKDLETVESVGCHFMRGLADGSQNIWAGNFWWATSDFLATVPSIFLRDRIKVSGIANVESRYEAEVWIGNGKLPTVKEYLPAGGEGVP